MNIETQAPPAGSPTVSVRSPADAASAPPIPKWVGVMVAVTLLGSMVGGGGLWAWSYYTRPDPKNLVEVGGPGSAFMQRSINLAPRPPQFPPIAPGISQLSATTYKVTGGDFLLLANRQPNGTDWNLSLQYTKPDLLTAEQKPALMARQRLASDPLFAKSLKVSDEQVEKLKAVRLLSPINPPLTLNAADLDKLKKMWIGFINAKPIKSAEAPALVASMQELAKASLVETRKTIAATVQQIQEILTPEQITAFK